jgi:hypothetical protein
MKVAQHPDSHQPLAASPDAPERAICPHCGGRLTLRRRQRMGGGCSYFWRHWIMSSGAATAVLTLRDTDLPCPIPHTLPFSLA